MRTLLYFLVLTALAVCVAVGDTNVTGKWTGTFSSTGPDGETRESSAVLMLKQNGGEITGTFGPDENDQQIAFKGKIAGDKITLVAEDEGRTVNFNLVLAADRITGDVNMVHSGQTARAKINVTRAK
jgi:hypothetical protein